MRPTDGSSLVGTRRIGLVASASRSTDGRRSTGSTDLLPSAELRSLLLLDDGSLLK